MHFYRIHVVVVLSVLGWSYFQTLLPDTLFSGSRGVMTALIIVILFSRLERKVDQVIALAQIADFKRSEQYNELEDKADIIEAAVTKAVELKQNLDAAALEEQTQRLEKKIEDATIAITTKTGNGH